MLLPRFHCAFHIDIHGVHAILGGVVIQRIVKGAIEQPRA